jgi:hypothetical protein
LRIERRAGSRRIRAKVIVQKRLPDRGRRSNIFEKKAVSEKWGQKNEKK